MTELSADDLRIRANQAKAAIESAGWAFDELAQEKFSEWLNSADTAEGQAQRERLWRAAQTAMRIKGDLCLTIDRYHDEETIREHRSNRTD